MSDTTVDNIKIVIKGEDKASSALDKQIQNLQNLSSIIQQINSKFRGASTKGIDKFAESMRKVGDASTGITKLANAIGRAQPENFSNFAEGIKLITHELESLEKVDASKLKDLADIARGFQGAGRSRATKAPETTATKDLEPKQGGGGEVEQTTGRASGSIQVFAQAMTFAKDAARGLSLAVRSARSAISTLHKAASTANRALIALGNVAELGPRFMALGNAVKGFGARVRSGFNDIMRIVKYRAIRSMIRMITQGFTEGLKNAYAYAKSIGDPFVNSMNQIATASQYLKNSLGAMAMPLINIVAPALDYIVDKFVAFLNFVNQAIASLTGQETWTKAIKYPTQWGDATADASGKASKAAKEAKATILGLDEINPLNGANDGGSGGGGGGGKAAADVAAMFETVATSEDLLNNWGERLADKINAGLDVIAEKFDGLPERAKAWTTAFANELNNLNDKLHWDTLGQDIGQGLNVIVYALNGFYETIHWEDFGTNLSTALNNAIEKFDTAELGKLLGNKFNSLWETALGFVKNFDFNQLGSKIATGINNYFETANLNAKAESLARFLNGALNTLATAVDEMDWDTITTALADSINTFVDSFDWKQAGIDLGKFIGKLAKAMVDLVKKIDWGDLLAGLAEGLVYALGTAVDEALLGEHKLSKDQWAEILGNPEPPDIEIGIKAGISNIEEFNKFFEWDDTQQAWVPNAQSKDVWARFKADIEETLEKVVDWWNNLFGGGDKETTLTATVAGATTDGFNKLFGKSGNNYAPKIVDKASKATAKGSSDSKFGTLWKWVKGDKKYEPNIGGKSAKATLKGATEKSFETAYSKWKNISPNKYGTWTVKANFDAKVDRLLNAKLNGTSLINITARAEGGYVNSGQVFVAREAGPEMVGTIGGQTAVANNDQIVQGIASGVAAGQAGQIRLLSEQNDLLRQLVAKQSGGGMVSTTDILRAMNGNNTRMGHPVVAMG